MGVMFKTMSEPDEQVSIFSIITNAGVQPFVGYDRITSAFLEGRGEVVLVCPVTRMRIDCTGFEHSVAVGGVVPEGAPWFQGAILIEKIDEKGIHCVVGNEKDMVVFPLPSSQMKIL